jgi:L-2-hydroxyglutarate oxidase LhgO
MITIIGGGIIGCSIAYELSKTSKDDIVVLEANKSITTGENQTSRNSGVVHAGIYYSKDIMPVKAFHCVRGNKLTYEFCEENKVPCKKTGKIVIAKSVQEEEYLDDVVRIATENGVEFKKINREEAQKFEPNVECTSGLYFPSSGIIEPTEYLRNLKILAENNGVYFLTNTKVRYIDSHEDSFHIFTDDENIETDYLINAGGVRSDQIAKRVNGDSPYTLSPIRGEAVKFQKSRREDIWMNGLNVYPAPHGVWPDGTKAEVPFKEFKDLLRKNKLTKTVGVHLTPTFDLENEEYVIGNTVTIGPSTVGNIDREDNRNSLPIDHFYGRVKDIFPNLKLEDLELHQAGVRAYVKGVHDFIIEQDSKYKRCINLIGIDSPGLTAAASIAKEVREMF